MSVAVYSWPEVFCTGMFLGNYQGWSWGLRHGMGRVCSPQAGKSLGPIVCVWDPTVGILRPHFNGMGWAHLGCMWDGDGTGSWDAFHQWGSHGNPQKKIRDGMG